MGGHRKERFEMGGLREERFGGIGRGWRMRARYRGGGGGVETVDGSATGSVTQKKGKIDKRYRNYR